MKAAEKVLRKKNFFTGKKPLDLRKRVLKSSYLAALDKNEKLALDEETLDQDAHLTSEELNNKGLELWKDKKAEGAIAYWEAAADEGNINALLNLAIVYRDNNDQENAKLYLKFAIEAYKDVKQDVSKTIKSISISPGGVLKNLTLINQFLASQEEIKRNRVCF